MAARAQQDVTRFTVAEDVGGIETLYASYRRYRLPRHVHDAFSISVSLSGGLAFDHHGSRHTAPSGVISSLEPGEVHNAYAPGDVSWSFLGLLVPPKLVLSILGEQSTGVLPGIPSRVIADPEMARRVAALFRRLETSPDIFERESACVSTLGEFFRRYSTVRPESALPRGREEIRRSCELLHACYAQPISLARIAAEAGMSRFHFLRAFRTEKGLGPHAYLNQIRVLEAKRKLAAGTPPAEVALACGFCDQSHLARQFKRAAVVTPGQYQKAFAKSRLVSRNSTLAGIGHLALLDGDHTVVDQHAVTRL